MKSRMYYKAMFEIPISIEVDILEPDVMIDQAKELLKQKAKDYLDEKYGYAFGMDYKELRMVPNTMVGVAVDFLPEEERSKYE